MAPEHINARTTAVTCILLWLGGCRKTDMLCWSQLHLVAGGVVGKLEHRRNLANEDLPEEADGSEQSLIGRKTSGDHPSLVSWGVV